AKNDRQREELFEKVRQGEIRILLGSTEKLGTGTNIQDKLLAVHHVDVPWRPSDLTQRDGRIVRQGNENKEVQIYRYVAKNSFDSFLWQT
ncbi:helicase-related protein, partial [Enterococcus faecium]